MTDQFATYASLRGQVAFVSGGATGLGAEFVAQLAAQGVSVSFVDLQDDAGQALALTVAELGHPPPLFQHCDVRDVAALQAAIAETAERLGPVTVLVNNAANDQRHSVEALSVQEWDDRLNVNLRHHFFATQAVAPMMRAAGRGSVINLGSISAHIDLLDLPVYISREVGDRGADAHAGARARRGRHPRQLRDPRLGHDRAPAHALGDARGRGRHRAQPVPAAEALPGRRRPHGPLARSR